MLKSLLIFFKLRIDRVYLLLALMLVLATYFPIKRAITLFKENQELLERIEKIELSDVDSSNASSDELFLLKSENDSSNFFTIIGEASIQQNVLVKDIMIPVSKEIGEGRFILETNTVVLQGDFIQILKVLNNIKDDIGPKKIASLKFETVEMNNVGVLLAQISFQQLKLNEPS